MATPIETLKQKLPAQLSDGNAWYRQCAGLCLAVLGGLSAIQNKAGFGAIVVGIVIGGGFGIAIVRLLPRLAIRFGGQPVAEHGADKLRELVLQTALMLIPFTILAVLSKLVFGWNAAVPFGSAALMTFGAAFGVQVSKLGGKKIAMLIMNAGIPAASSMAWSLLISLLK